ncbi:DNA mismatch repair endonuclease MutL [Bowmanella yangjiangensis]|uniref:DNA mismatch repair protein MutL n=1 Tax=Bowmanella yangjiangensis TaxID=2811230 RepID=A0ABS3CQ56_9ALTE|nr:DNA mismatch repair endonuclease MutL [Bowmanella yangjiangensis]MBN7819247.1 DNA mismatch repair endonuclease MutL [Bowmanella yangjiangensis]
MPIQILPARLANQIAAGEVVERPASVIKELVENSLDAGADKIDLEIDRGGHKRILIRDNGSGIARDELELALSRHATSKISCLDDLEQIMSLGFRGEALASISSVARLTLTSKPATQSEAWQAKAEGRDMAVQLQPTAHPDGTSVEVLDLFFNTPARRKFLRSEKTEFQHIDETLKRIALSRFDVAFSLKHNGKLLRHYPKANTEASRQKRVALVCSAGFGEHALNIQSQYQGLHLHGWLAVQSSNTPDHQYFYVNGRMMRDKLIHHAIRQAFEGLLPPEGHAAYVLYLQLDAREVDVNVHPAKHEVRFHQARLVHDFIFRALQDALNQATAEIAQEDSTSAPIRQIPAAEPNHNYIKPLQSKVTESPGHYQSGGVSSRGAQHYQQLMQTPTPSPQAIGSHYPWLLVQQRYLLLNHNQVCCLLPVKELHKLKIKHSLASAVSQPLLMPVALSLQSLPDIDLETKQAALAPLGFVLSYDRHKLMLKQVPAGLRQLNWPELLPLILDCPHGAEMECLLDKVADKQQVYSEEQVKQWWQWCEQQALLEELLNNKASPLPLEQWIQAYAN